VAKHGNRSFTSKCGSADVLENLGVKLLLKPFEVEKIIEQVGIGFIYAPAFHPAMRYAVEPRRQLGIRTIFNVLGPLTNPASAKAQLLGVYDYKLTKPIAESLRLLGCEEAMVVHGIGGIDEVSTIGKTAVSWLRDGEVKNIELTPKDFGVKATNHDSIKGCDPAESAEILFKVLNGMADIPRTDIVLVNSVAGIIVSGKTDDFSYAMELARESVVSGAAYDKLYRLVKASGGDLSRLKELEARYA
jgi:anthranilate phosphoribosyltransferase